MSLRNIISRSSIICLSKTRNTKQVGSTTDLFFIQSTRKYTTEDGKNSDPSS